MTHLREIIISLADAKVDFVVGGGVACVLQGVERFTLDLDVLDIAALRRLLNDE